MFNRNLGIRCLAKDHDIELCMAVNYREGEVDPPHPHPGVVLLRLTNQGGMKPTFQAKTKTKK